VLAADSSSASANSRLTVLSIEWASPDALTLRPAEGPSFLTRPAYLAAVGVPVDSLAAFVAAAGPGGAGLDEEKTEAVLRSGAAYIAEKAAMGYLSRAEQSRFGLSRKLGQKKHSAEAIRLALDYLESKSYLDDSRYAEAWLRERLIHHAEGREALLAGLLSRGIGRDVAREAVSACFAEVDEADLCRRAIDRLARQGKTGVKLQVALARKGFPRGIIAACLGDVE